MQEDIGFAMEIGSITYVRPYSCGGWAGSFSMKMAHVAIDQLSETFADNYEPGSLQEVVFIDSLPLAGASGSTLTITFDQPFWYNGVDNLLIDICYPDGWACAGVHNWEAGPARSLVDLFPYSGSAGATGELFTKVPYMILEGELELMGMTFGGIKVELGQDR